MKRYRLDWARLFAFEHRLDVIPIFQHFAFELIREARGERAVDFALLFFFSKSPVEGGNSSLGTVNNGIAMDTVSSSLEVGKELGMFVNLDKLLSFSNSSNSLLMCFFDKVFVGS
jgi:hypothetical protein